MNKQSNPTSCAYLIVGSGRMAKHFSHYLNLLNIPHRQWARRQNSMQQLAAWSTEVSHVLLLISDQAIKEFVHTHPVLLKNQLVHFSGALSFDFADSAHPLNTFGPELYSLETYQRTPFVIEPSGLSFTDLLPGLPNPHHTLRKELKPLYHALCVMSGNFSTLLWQSAFELFERDLKLPREVLTPYLEQMAKNLVNHPQLALTGPLARQDRETILKNLESLDGLPEQELYCAFVKYFNQRMKKPFENEVTHEGP